MEKIIKKVSSGIGAIKRVRHLVPQATLQLIYQALIHPHFNYCNTVWGNCGITLRNKLQKLQNRAARVLTFSDYDEDVGYLFELLGWKNLARQHGIKKATMVYKYLHGLATEYLCSRFAIRETAYNLRDSDNKPCISLPRTNYYWTKITLAIVAPSYGTNSRVMWGNQSPLRNSNVFLNRYSRAQHSWKGLNTFYNVIVYNVFLFEL